ADGAVGGRHLAEGAVGSAHLADGAVGGRHLAERAVGSAHLADGAIHGRHLSAGAVTADKLAFVPVLGAQPDVLLQQGIVSFRFGESQSTASVTVEFRRPFAGRDYAVVATVSGAPAVAWLTGRTAFSADFEVIRLGGAETAGAIEAELHFAAAGTGYREESGFGRSGADETGLEAGAKRFPEADRLLATDRMSETDRTLETDRIPEADRMLDGVRMPEADLAYSGESLIAGAKSTGAAEETTGADAPG